MFFNMSECAKNNICWYKMSPLGLNPLTEWTGRLSESTSGQASLSQDVCKACGQVLPEEKDIPGSSGEWTKLNEHWTLCFICKLKVSHVVITYHICITPVYWSRLERNRYGTNRYSPIYISSFISLKVLYLYKIDVLIDMNLSVQNLKQLNWSSGCQ